MYNTKPALLVLLPLLLLSACADEKLELPSVVSSRRAELATTTFDHAYSANLFSNDFMNQIAAQYERYGAGPLYVTATFDPKGGDDAAGEATRIAARISNYLKAHGANDTQWKTQAVPNNGPDHQVGIKYGMVVAQAPEGCHLMPGMENKSATTLNTQYGYGCTVETAFAQQVARPADLAGRAPDGVTSDGARHTAVLNDRGYYGDKAFAPLSGESSSDME